MRYEPEPNNSPLFYDLRNGGRCVVHVFSDLGDTLDRAGLKAVTVYAYAPEDKRIAWVLDHGKQPESGRAQNHWHYGEVVTAHFGDAASMANAVVGSWLNDPPIDRR